MKSNDLKIYTKTENLRNRIYPNLRNFPKSEKFALSQDIRHDFTDLLRCISLANKVKSRRMIHAQEADGYLQVIKSHFRLARNQKYISLGFYKDIDLELTEIGKMISGYIRAI